VISPIYVGLDSEAVSSASLGLFPESSSPDTILGHKSTCSESQLLGSPDIAVLNSVLLRAVARRSTPPYGGVLPLTKLTHFRRESRRGRPTRARTRPPQRGSVRVGSVCVVVAVAAATARAKRGRNLGRKQAPSYGGLTRPAALPPHPALGRATPSLLGGVLGGRLRYRTLHYANARVRTPTDHGLSVSIPISGVSA